MTIDPRDARSFQVSTERPVGAREVGGEFGPGLGLPQVQILTEGKKQLTLLGMRLFQVFLLVARSHEEVGLHNIV